MPRLIPTVLLITSAAWAAPPDVTFTRDVAPIL